MSQAQYERLADAAERLAVQSAHATQRAVDGWGRKNNLSAEYLTPTPFVKNLGINLKKWGNKEALDFFNAAAEKGIWDLPVDDIHRINTLMAIVEILPDEYALDASMYPASMRENVAFYRRVRTKLGRELIGDATGAPMPPDNQPAVGPDVNPITRKSGRLTAASDLLSSVRSKIEKTIANVEKINNRIAKLEEAHKASADKLRTYDIIDAHLNGVSQKAIAKKYRMTVADVNKFLKSKQIVQAFEALKASEARVRALEDTIGKKRSVPRPAN
jgi:transposase